MGWDNLSTPINLRFHIFNHHYNFIIMTITDIKTAISSTHGFQLGTLSMVQQFQSRKLLPTDTLVEVKNETGDVVNASYDPKDPDKVYDVKTEWVSHWNNDYRVRISMPLSIMEAIKSDLNKADLATKKEIMPGKDGKASYTRYVVITPKNILANF